MGGKEKLATLKSVKMSGTMSVQGTDISLTLTKVHLTGMRMDIEAMGTSNYQLANNAKGWIFMPVMGMDSPKEMDADQYKTSINQMDVQGNLFNYKEKGTTVELVGKEMVDGSEANKIKTTFKNGESATYFIDTKTNRKQNADGYWFAYSMTNSQGTIIYDKIETNVPVDEKIFSN